MTWNPQRILFVDDEPELLDSLADVWGLHYDVSTARGGEAGLAALAKHQPHVVVSDMRMPGMDGATFLGRVGKRAPGTVRLLLTGQADLEAALRAVNEGGIFKFLTKPCPPDVMGPVLEAACMHYMQQEADRQRLGAKVEQLSTQLAHAEKLATLGTMSASLGHEMNNALAILECAVEEIRLETAAGQLPDPEVLKSLVLGKDRLLAQARGALSLARREARDPRPLDLAQVARDVAGVLATLGLTRRVQIAIHAGPEPMWVVADRTEVEQIVINLVKNSIDAITEHRRTGRIDIHVHASDRRIELAVIDDGGGIPAALLPRIFEPYFTTKASGSGTGLGLPLVKRLVEGYGGTIAVTSEAGRGTTFTLDLPRRVRNATTYAPATTPIP